MKPLKDKNNKMKNKSGITIIEAVLVLAIAGLIFLAVFIALPALQRNRRDTQRRQDMARLQDALTRYKANNRKYPWNFYPDGQYDNRYAEGVDDYIRSRGFSQDQFIADYLGDDFKDPLGDSYTISFKKSKRTTGEEMGMASAVAKINHIFVVAYVDCEHFKIDRSGYGYYVPRESVTNANKYAIVFGLESGAGGCLEGNVQEAIFR